MTVGPRLVIVGRNSKVWSRLEMKFPSLARGALALGHRDLDATALSPADTVWILSYSRDPAENRALFDRLAALGAGRFFYLSTATANVASVTRCFAYPTAKADAEAYAERVLGARTVRVGIVYDALSELPGGCSAATSLEEIASAMSAFEAPPIPRELFSMVERPFGSRLEKALFSAYGALLSLSKGFPCLLRPLDVLLRAAGMRWYGYLYLSNRLWLRQGRR